MRVPVGLLLRLALSLGIVAAGFPPRLALCLGSDGHRAIEVLDAPCCPPGASSAGMIHRCAPTCTDLPLSVTVGVRSSERGHLDVHLSATAVPHDVSPTTAPTRIARRLGDPSASAPPVAEHLGSTVLLC
jgi:hypothetical protein